MGIHRGDGARGTAARAAAAATTGARATAAWPISGKPIWRQSLTFFRRAAGYEPVWTCPRAAAFTERAGQIAMSYSTIEFHPGPRVASIVLNRPPLNIINLQMLDELNAVWTEVEDLKAQV